MNHEKPAPSHARRRAQLRQIERQQQDGQTSADWEGFSRIFAVWMLDAQKMIRQAAPPHEPAT